MPLRGKRTPTIKDVAQRAAVSIGTVSRVLNQQQNVDTALRQRVNNAIRDLGYRPNARARSFVRERSNVVAFVLANDRELSSVYAPMLLGIEEQCAAAGYHLLFTRFSYDPHLPPEGLQLPSVLADRGLADCAIPMWFGTRSMMWPICRARSAATQAR